MAEAKFGVERRRVQVQVEFDADGERDALAVQEVLRSLVQRNYVVIVRDGVVTAELQEGGGS